MPTSIFCAPDLHKRDTDFNSIIGYRDAINAVQQDIINYLKDTEHCYFISMGDWYDKGYRNTARTFIDAWYDQQINEAVEERAFICTGNHLFLERDANPEMYIIQPSYLHKPKEPVPMTKPIFHTVPYLIIGNVQISFFHFHKTEKNYVQQRQPGVDVHIGIYHDDCVLPSDIRQMDGYFGNTSNEYLNNIYSNIDFALFGHIHTAVGIRTFTMNDGRTIPLIIPGSLGITSTKEGMIHKSVQCPVFTIQDDGSFDFYFKEISTHLELLKMYRQNDERVQASSDIDLSAISGASLEIRETHSLLDFLTKKGYPDRDIELVMSAVPGKFDLNKLYTEEGA